MKTQKENQEESRRQEIIEIKQILPFLGEVNGYLYKLNASLRPDPDNDNQYANWVFEIKMQLDFIASALTDENGERFGGICQDGHIFRLLKLYEDSIQIPTKSLQEKLILELLIKVCSAIIIANGSGEGHAIRHIQADYALDNTRKFINHLVKEHERNNWCREKNIWFDLREENYITHE